MEWCASGRPISAYERLTFSRAIRNELTRVMSAWNASTCRSNISSAYSLNVSRHADRPLRHRQIAVVGLALRDALLHLANGVEIFTQLDAVARAELAGAAARSPASRHRECCGLPGCGPRALRRCRRCRTAVRTRTVDWFPPAAASSASSTTSSSCRRRRSRGRRRRRRRCGRRPLRATRASSREQICSAIS